MKINWNPNPFLTSIELNDDDKNHLLASIQNEEYAELLCRISRKLKDDEYKNQDEIATDVKKWQDICNMDQESDEFKRYIFYLDDTHIGDCTCFAATCFRCLAEEMLGIDTKEKCYKHEFNVVMNAFYPKLNEHPRTIDEAILQLEKEKVFIKPDNWPSDKISYEYHIPRWEQERKNALSWLKKYKENHGF
jgi:hypothetical protein